VLAKECFIELMERHVLCMGHVIKLMAQQVLFGVTLRHSSLSWLLLSRRSSLRNGVRRDRLKTA
jgi:hypothetical protein